MIETSNSKKMIRMLFMPFGILLPMVHQKLQKFHRFLLVFVFGISVLEILQLITKVGSFDVDDIILNTIGAVLGFGLLKLLYRVVGNGGGI